MFANVTAALKVLVKATPAVVACVGITAIIVVVVKWLVPDSDFENSVNVVDVVVAALTLLVLVTTIVIAWLVWDWDKWHAEQTRQLDERNAERALLWDVTRDHFRTVLALYEGKYDADEAEKALMYIRRTIVQIKILDGSGSDLATAFKTVVDIPDWGDNSDNSGKGNAVDALLIEMINKFGWKSAKSDRLTVSSLVPTESQ
jgi:hypothetical protein